MNRKDEITNLVVQRMGIQKVDRTYKLTADLIKKIREAWELGIVSERGVCSYVGISAPTYSKYMTMCPELEELKELCQEKINIEARKNIKKAIERGHLDTSKWYLEKTDPQFQKNSDTTVNVAVISVADREKEMNKFMERFTDAGVIDTTGTEIE